MVKIGAASRILLVLTECRKLRKESITHLYLPVTLVGEFWRLIAEMRGATRRISNVIIYIKAWVVMAFKV